MPELKREQIDVIESKLEEIFTSDIDTSTYEGTVVPHKDDLTDTDNYSFECAILFVDIRSSTQLSDESMPSSMAKIYRAFARAIIMSINYCGGSVRQIVGDRVMGVFISDDNESAAKKSFHASRAIVSVVEHLFNPLCKKYVNNKTIGCGVGIDYGKVLLAKVGISSRNEEATELVWAGRRANIASKHTDLAEAGEIFVTKRYFDKLPKEMTEDDEGNPLWEKIVRMKSNSIFEGYSAKNFFLDIMKEQEGEKSVELSLANRSVKSEYDIDGVSQGDLVSNIIQETKKQTEILLTRFEPIVKREAEVAEREKRVSQVEKRLEQEKRDLDEKEDKFEKKVEYEENRAKFDVKVEFFRDNINSYKLEKALSNMKELYTLGGKINKSKFDIQAEMFYTVTVSYFSKHEKHIAYRLIIEQLINKHPWINIPNEEVIVDVVKQLDKKEEYFTAVRTHATQFNPTANTLLTLIKILEKLGISKERITSNIQSLPG
ncbi:adenylate/guanylate cyclase domain-containing protein [Halobacillus trueperi]|uniref:Adenylate/guanylate cyclase domain-containing protein n=1 Tax=Halobacillus trueperi TaxID=156205 RepID=A0A3D8VNB7_9BACI|nr:adenylate/guanylate cyclase domain-containing protein [Halobacillus trueperi]RDY70860.1 adenylate/guanylate cyclase domain-containing protein [Halobacillus trueperi]